MIPMNGVPRYECDECGAVVAFPARHGDWHKQLRDSRSSGGPEHERAVDPTCACHLIRPSELDDFAPVTCPVCGGE